MKTAHTHTQLWGAEVLQPLFSRAPLTASAVSDGGGNRAAGRWRREEEGWRDGGSQPGRLDRLWAVTLQLNEPTLPG